MARWPSLCILTYPNWLDRVLQIDLVRIHIDHKLLTTKGACKPWFVLMDAGVRAYIGHWRMKINKATADR